MTIASYTPLSFADALLSGIGAPVTPTNERTVEDWAAAEGGAGPQWGIPNNTDGFNPLNTTLPEPGATSTNSAGVKSYTSWAQGLQATVATLLSPAYSSIVTDLRSNTAEAQVAADVGASSWGTPNWDPGGTPSAGGGPATAQLASYNANPFDLFGIPQTIAGAAASSVWKDVGPFLVKAVLVIFGLGLVGMGAWRASSAARNKVEGAAPALAEAAA